MTPRQKKMSDDQETPALTTAVTAVGDDDGDNVVGDGVGAKVHLPPATVVRVAFCVGTGALRVVCLPHTCHRWQVSERERQWVGELVRGWTVSDCAIGG